MPHPRSAGNKYECGRWLLYATLLALLGGCQRAGPDAAFEVYARGTSSPQLIVPTDALEEPPVAAAMQLDIPSGTLDALDLVSLSGCNVQATIGKRNSSLGRHAKPSQRLLLELEYLRLAPQCINLLRDRHWALANVLDVASARSLSACEPLCGRVCTRPHQRPCMSLVERGLSGAES
jgi:hypothetical protein